MLKCIDAGEMPDAETCRRTPRDQFGEPMEAGRWYWIGGKRMQCYDDCEAGCLTLHPVNHSLKAIDGRSQLVSELKPSVEPLRIME